MNLDDALVAGIIDGGRATSGLHQNRPNSHESGHKNASQRCPKGWPYLSPGCSNVSKTNVAQPWVNVGEPNGRAKFNAIKRRPTEAEPTRGLLRPRQNAEEHGDLLTRPTDRSSRNPGLRKCSPWLTFAPPWACIEPPLRRF